VTRRLVLAVMTLALVGLILPSHIGRFMPPSPATGSMQLAAAVTPMRPAAAGQPACLIPLSILCPSPTPTPSPSGSSRPTPTSLPTLLPTGTASPNPSSLLPGRTGAAPSKKSLARKAAAGKKASSVKATASPGLMVTEAQFSLTTGSALLLGTAYDGVAQVPTASGATVAMMKFTMSSLMLTGTPTLTVIQGARTAVTTATSMHFSGNVVLYATQLSGDLLGVPVTLTPSSPLSTVLQLLNSVTPLVPLRLTNVTTTQPYISSDSFQIPGLLIRAS
jgi:hypothetical protein